MKRIGSKVWVAVSAMRELPKHVRVQARSMAKAMDFDFDLVRYDRSTGSIMLGRVPDLGTEPVPELLESLTWTPGGSPKHTVYADPPVYHRTEQMLLPGDGRRAKLARATKRFEEQGLLSRPDIGRRSSWAKAKKARGRGAIGDDSDHRPGLVLALVADAFGVLAEDLVGRGRSAKVSQARHAAAAALRKGCDLTLVKIGRILGGRSTSVIGHAIQTAAKLSAGDPEYRDRVDWLIGVSRVICFHDPSRGRAARRGVHEPHPPGIRHSAGIALFVGPRLLLLRRTDNGLWNTPGGGIEPGEDAWTAARRESWEEASLRVPAGATTSVATAPTSSGTYTLYGVRALRRPRVRLDRSENDRARWVTPTQLRRLPLVTNLIGELEDLEWL